MYLIPFSSSFRKEVRIQDNSSHNSLKTTFEHSLKKTIVNIKMLAALLLETEYFSANLRTERPLPPLLSLINKILVSIRVALWVNKWMYDQFFLFRHIFYLSRLFLFLFCFWLVPSPFVFFWLVCFISAWFLLYIFQYYSLSILLPFGNLHHINQINARMPIQTWLNEKCMVSLDECPL